MSFEVTATKKRPHLFDQLVGQDFVVSTLKSSIEQGRIAHAYLFSGPRGVGKTSAARILAKALNCEQGPTTAPCGQCSLCTEIARGTSLDVIEIDGASNTSVNDVRELKDEVLFAPNSGRYKIYIIDEVHMLSNSAFNALLKTIEEPPPYIVFVFATTEVHKVPATIRSRCQQFNFRLLQVDTIREQLAAAATEMGIEAEDEALFWISKEATGSLRDAYTLFDQIVSFSDGAISLAKIQEKLGLAGAETIDAIAEAMARGDSPQVFSLMEEVLSRGVPIEQFVVDLTEYFRNVLFIKHGIDRENILGYPVSHFSLKTRQVFSTTQIEYAVELLLELYRNLRYSLNQRFELELALSKLSSLTEKLSGEELLYEIENLRQELIHGSSGSDNEAQEAKKKASKAARPQLNRNTEAAASKPEKPQEKPSAPAESASAAPEAAAAESSAAAPDPAPAESAPARAASMPTQPSKEQHRAATEETQQPEPPSPEEPSVDTASADKTALKGRRTDSVQRSSEQPLQTRPNQAAGATAKKNDTQQGNESHIGSTTGADTLRSKQQSKSEKVKRELTSEEVSEIKEQLRLRPTLASALRKTKTWSLSGETLIISCESSYSARKIREELEALREVTAGFLGARVEIKVRLIENTGKQTAGSADEQIELVKKVFRGQIVHGAKHESDGSL